MYTVQICRRTCLASAISSLLLSFPFVAKAQQSADDPLAIENITVTAQRTAESIQSTPVTVTALSATDVERMQIDNAKDLSQIAPNVNFKPASGGSAGLIPYIRGGGVTDTATITSEAEVGIYIDDVYQPRAASSFIEMLDLQRIEILSGPQGTLYGRNSSAGALKIISRVPDELFRFKNEAGVGSWNEKYNKLMISGALNDTGSLRGGISALYRDRDGGRQYNATLDKEVGAETFKGAQGDLFYEGDDLTVRLKAFVVDYDSDGVYGSAVDSESLDNGYENYAFTSGSIDTVLSPKASYTHDEQVGASLHVTKILRDDMSISSITSWNNLKNDWGLGFGGGNYVAWLSDDIVELFERDSTSDQDAFSQELQIQGSAMDGMVQYVGGLYYFRESGEQNITSVIFLAPSYSDFEVSTDSYAIFGQASVAFSDQLSLILGGRYTKDDKDLWGSLSGEEVTTADDFSKFTPKVALEYQAQDNLFLFASYTQGFKAGGYNSLAATTEALATAYDMQVVTAYEAGLKSQWLNNRVRLNLATFYNDYENLQQQSVTESGVFITENYDAKHYGLEADFRMRVSSGVTLWANGVYQDSEYTDSSIEGEQINGSLIGNEMTNVFPFQYTLGADYSVDIGNGTLALGANVNRKADHFASPDNAEMGHVPAVTLYDAYASYTYDRWKVSLAGKNLTNEKYWFTGFGFDVLQTRLMSDPRMWRLSVAYTIE